MTRQVELFVYGTLMRGERHHAVLGDARFLGEAVTAPAFDLVQIDYYPALIPGGRLAVRGELYSVEPETLQHLDELEEVPHYYVRERVPLADGRRVDSYLMPRERAHAGIPLATGDFRISKLR